MSSATVFSKCRGNDVERNVNRDSCEIEILLFTVYTHVNYESFSIPVNVTFLSPPASIDGGGTL